jgi:Rrf2 family protein
MEEPGRVVSTRELAERFNISLSLLRKIFFYLQRSGLIEAVRGSRGGYRLARPLGSITLQELAVGLRGPLQVVECLGEGGCEQAGRCTIRQGMGRFQGLLDGLLSSMTLKAFADMDGQTALGALGAAQKKS